MSIVNEIHCCDNLDLLEKIGNDSIQLIYCDILYGTGRKLKDYQDLKQDKDVIYNFYEPRIKELHRVLSKRGSIYLQMDSRISGWIRDIMDKYFGYDNFLNQIIWPREQSKGAKSKSKCYAKNSDHILFYSKTDEYVWNGCFVDYSKEYIDKRFRPDETGRLFMDCPLGSHANNLEELEKQNRIYVTKNGGKRYKRYFDELQGVAVGDVWDDIYPINSNANENTGYSTQKPKELLRRIIKTSSKEGDIVADFFCGSGVTCVVSKEMKRNFIGCDINQNAVDIAKRRVI